MSAKKLLLLDGTALAYRSYFAMQKTALTNSKGAPTGAVLGFINTMMMLVREQQPDFLALGFDPPGPTFRHKLYADYKANRSPMPDDLRAQMPVLHRLAEAWPCPVIEVPGMEADDMLGSYAAQLAGDDLDIVLVTGDKDFYQLLSPHVFILNPGRGTAAARPKLIGTADIREKFGVDTPSAVIDVLALMGDASDNVPGVPGVGPKTAGKLISEFGDLDNLYENLDRVKSVRLREKLAAKQPEARLARALVTIKTDQPLRFGLEAMTIRDPGGPKWVDLLRDLEFKNLLRDYETADETPQSRESYRLITSPGDLKTLAKELREKRGRPVFMACTAPGHPLEAPLLGVAVAMEDGPPAYINMGHPGEKQVSPKNFRAVIGPILSDPEIPKASHDIKQLGLILGNAGVAVDGFDFDAMLASYLQNPERRHTLDALVLEHEGCTLPPAPSKQPMCSWTAGEAARYWGSRARAVSRLQGALVRSLKQGELEDLFRNVELPLAHVLETMERTGITVDRAYLEAMSERLAKELARLEQSCWDLAGGEFNLNSPKQLGELLFERLGLPTGKKTKTGFSTDSEVLDMLRDLHPLPGLLLEYRRIAKLKSTYVDTLPQMILLETGRIHARFNQAVAATGRLSSSDPNLQNIPIRSDLGREVRRAFIAGRADWVLVSADYSQIELRIMADLSGDEALVQAFRKGVDVHSDTASRLFGIPEGNVTGVQRTQAKAVNFGILYGQGAFGLARSLRIAQSEAQAFIEDYKKTYRGVVQYLEGTLERAREQGYVTTLMNRRRYLPNLNARSRLVRSAAERLAINTPIQGSAADMIKVAMVRLNPALEERKLSAHLLATVHDELLLECPQKEASAVEDLVVEIMTGALKLKVPVVVNVGIGKNWADIHS